MTLAKQYNSYEVRADTDLTGVSDLFAITKDGMNNTYQIKSAIVLTTCESR